MDSRLVARAIEMGSLFIRGATIFLVCSDLRGAAIISWDRCTFAAQQLRDP